MRNKGKGYFTRHR